MALKNSIFLLLLLTICVACTLEVPVTTAKKIECKPPIDIIVTVADSSVSQYAIKLSLIEPVSGAESVSWKITHEGAVLLNSTNVPVHVRPNFPLPYKGIYEITCNIKNYCGETTILTKTINYGAGKVCINATSITVTGNATALNLSIDGSTADITSVIWTINNNSGTAIYTSSSITASPFSVVPPAITATGTLTVVATITDKCQKQYSLNTNFVSCTKPTGISVAAAGNPTVLNLSIDGSTADISSVVWTINNNGTAIYTSSSITASPFSVVPPAITATGTLAVVATITDKCQKQYSLNTNFVSCTKPTGISVTPLSTTESPLDLNLKLNGSTSDIASVIWLITQNNNEVYKKTVSDSPFAIPSTSTLSLSGDVGDYLITAKVTDKCGLTYDFTSNYSYSIPNALRVPMVLVEGGTFSMGSDKERAMEKPVHDVTLNSFYMGKYEVTQKQWKAVMGEKNPSYSNPISCDNCPTAEISWDDIQTYLNLLKKQTGKSYRLPTEAEWEYAARGGNASRNFIYAGSPDIDAVAWYLLNSNGKANEVGRKSPNELGLYDMSGGVMEWCNDWFSVNYYSISSKVNPTGPSSGISRVLRGGSWKNSEYDSRIPIRNGDIPSAHGLGIGFRVVYSK